MLSEADKSQLVFCFLDTAIRNREISSYIIYSESIRLKITLINFTTPNEYGIICHFSKKRLIPPLKRGTVMRLSGDWGMILIHILYLY